MVKPQNRFTWLQILLTYSTLCFVLGGVLVLYNYLSNQAKKWDFEAQVEQQTREAIREINKELRLATAYFEVPIEGLPQAKEILIIRPHSRSGKVEGYTLVRYWFTENHKGLYSLLRAEKDHGLEAQFLGNEMGFQPKVKNLQDRRNYNIRYLVKEATVLEPGKLSFFQQSTANPNLIHVRMVTAFYESQVDDAALRKFRVDTDIHAGNLVL